MSRHATAAATSLIGQPLAYQYLTSIRPDALPATTDDLLRMRGRGWLSNFPVGNLRRGPGPAARQQPAAGTPACRRTASTGMVEWTGSVTAGSLSDPRLRRQQRRPAGGRPRVSCGRRAALASACRSSRGAWLNERARRRAGRRASVDRSRQQRRRRRRGVSRPGRFLVRGEAIRSTWTMPAFGDAAARRAAAWRSSMLVEGRYRSLPGVLRRGARRAPRLQQDVATTRGPQPMGSADVALRDRRRLFADRATSSSRASWQRNRPRRRPRPPATRCSPRRCVVLVLKRRAADFAACCVALRRSPLAVAPSRRAAPGRRRRPREPGHPRPARHPPARQAGRRRRPDVADSGARRVRATCPDLRRGVVYLETAPRGAFDEREPGRAVMDQRNETFVPHVLAVMAGTVVDFPNSDLTYHNVFSLSRAKRFDLGRYAAGKSKSGALRSPWRRARVLRHPLAHERVRAGVQPSVLRRHRRRRPLRAPTACRRAPTPWSAGTKARRASRVR